MSHWLCMLHLCSYIFVCTVTSTCKERTEMKKEGKEKKHRDQIIVGMRISQFGYPER